MVRTSQGRKRRAMTPRKKLFAYIGVVFAAVLAAVGSWLGNSLISGISSRVSTTSPVVVSVVTDPSQIDTDLKQQAVLPESRAMGSPGPFCSGFHAWMKSLGGIDGSVSLVRLVVQGRSKEAVLLSNLRVEIVDSHPRASGLQVTCPSAAQAQIRAITINLDAHSPKPVYLNGQPFGFTIAEGETEVLNIVARTMRAYYRWYLWLDFIINGQTKSYRISDDGKPFATTSWSSRAAEWSWDYSGAWEEWVNGHPGRTVPVADFPLRTKE